MNKKLEYNYLSVLLLVTLAISSLHFIFGEVVRGLVFLSLYIIGIFYMSYLKSNFDNQNKDDS